MIKYLDIDNDSGIEAYEIGLDKISVKFRNTAKIYVYSYASAGKENMVAQGENTGYNDCGQEEREERKSKNKRDKEGKSEYDKSLYL